MVCFLSDGRAELPASPVQSVMVFLHVTGSIGIPGAPDRVQEPPTGPMSEFLLQNGLTSASEMDTVCISGAE